LLQPKVLRVLALAASMILGLVPQVWAQTQNGQITGTVVNAESLQPLGAIQVYIDGTGRASITRSDGSYTITNVPPGTYTVIAQSIGYQQARQTGINVGAGSTATVNFQLAQNVLSLQGVVATGLIDPVEGARSPITVGQVTREQMPVSAGSADPVTQLQGKVAGVTISRTGGQPGQDAAVRLRTPTSAVGSNRPLYVVDGVILGTDPVSIESSDIESIEVVKGAAAASLYGSRAASGVIAITTNRGRSIAAGETRFAFNSEYGRSEPADFLPMPRHHQFATNAQGQLVNAQGTPVQWSGRFEPQVAFMDKTYPAEFGVFNNLKEIYRPGGFNTQNFSITSNAENTNFAASVGRLFEQGAIEGNQGYNRNNFRVNLDHRFKSTMQLGISAYHARSFRDDIGSGAPGGNGGLLGDFFLIPPYIDLSQRNDQGEFNRFYGAEYGAQVEHPVWRQLNRDFEQNIKRTLGNANLRWSPFNWLSVVSDVSFDLEDLVQETYVPKGAQDPSGETYDGRLAFANRTVDTFNGSLQGSIRRDFGPLNSRTTVRGIMERANTANDRAEGQDFRVYDVKRIDAAAIKVATSSMQEIRSTGYLIDQAFDYDGKYIVSVLGRRDGSSLFGPQNRWHNYYRAAGAWRIAEEPWFNVDAINEFKIKASRGTAGGRPGYSNQYETWSVTDAGVTKGTLGNRNLRPEHTTENEVGLELILFSNLGIELVYAQQRTEHQLYNLLLPGAVGYTSQWVNVGTLAGRSLELAIESRLIDRPNLTWTTNIVADRSQSKVEDWPVPCRILDQITYICNNTNPRDLYGFHYYRSMGELPAHLAPFADQFQVNDDGFVVWVGTGNSWRDGQSKNLWGTSTSILGQTYAWGYPVLQRDQENRATFARIGEGDPNFQLGWMNTVSWRGLTAHAQMHAQIGGEVYNMTKHYTIFDKVHPVLDQAGKADESKKPIAYYVNGLYNGSIISDAFVEDASYLKLRQLSLTYRFSPEMLSRTGMGLRGVELGIVGRNLFTIDRYSGFDPEVVSNSRLTPLDNYSYPAMRNYTVSVGVNF
jgi:TonB-linked SusC/RagA family outer membrane protein